MTKSTKKPRKRNYINNSDMYNSLVDYFNKKKENPDTRIPDYIGQCLMQIASNLSNKKNFNGYSYKDEMIADGVENSILYLHSFDPNKTNNPFAYFTQTIKFAFIRRIQKEKKQQYIKVRNTMHYLMTSDIDNEERTTLEHDIGHNNAVFVDQYEDMLRTKKMKANMVLDKGNKESTIENDTLEAFQVEE